MTRRWSFFFRCCFNWIIKTYFCREKKKQKRWASWQLELDKILFMKYLTSARENIFVNKSSFFRRPGTLLSIRRDKNKAGWAKLTVEEKFERESQCQRMKNWKSFSNRFKFLSDSSHLARLPNIFEVWFFLWTLIVHERKGTILKKTTMATQNSTDEETYKREYCRIKSLVSSAYVRQTSVSSLHASKFWGIEQTCFAVAHVFNCYVTAVIYSTNSSTLKFVGKFSLLCNTFLGWDQTV